MSDTTFNISPEILAAFENFKVNSSLLALILILTDGTLQALPPVNLDEPQSSTQAALNQLNAVLNPWTAQYMILRRDESLVAITFVPYLADEIQRKFLLEHRHELVQQLGEEHFSQSLICKEIGDITDARSWKERDEASVSDNVQGASSCNEKDCKETHVKDLGYQRTKCRLCDRRMQNKIAPEAATALKSLLNPGAAVQISVSLTTEILTLNSSNSNLAPSQIAPLIPTETPSFTFFSHPTTHLIYFIFHSPDSASVQARMKHTMAIPGLLVHAEDAGVRVDQKIEIHEPEDLVFDEKDERVGKFRSMYNRKGFVGTESVYAGMEADKKFLESVR